MKGEKSTKLTIEPVHYSSNIRKTNLSLSPYKQPNFSRLELRQQLLDDLESLNMYKTKVSFYNRYKKQIRVSIMFTVLAAITAAILVLLYPRQLQMSIKGSNATEQLRLEIFNPNLYPVYITNLQVKVDLAKREVDSRSYTLERYVDAKTKFLTELQLSNVAFNKSNDQLIHNLAVKVKLEVPIFSMIHIKEPNANFLLMA